MGTAAPGAGEGAGGAGAGAAAVGAGAAAQQLADAAAWAQAAAPFPLASTPVLYLGALPQLADGGASLPPLPDEYSSCNLVREAGDASKKFVVEFPTRSEQQQQASGSVRGAAAVP